LTVGEGHKLDDTDRATALDGLDRTEAPDGRRLRQRVNGHLLATQSLESSR
jgi:hypothetical protein